MPAEAQTLLRKNIAKTSGAVSVTTGSTVVLGENLSRQEVSITNDGANIIYLQLATARAADGTATAPTAVASQGIRLNASGGTWSSDVYTGPIAGIALTGTTVATVIEI